MSGVLARGRANDSGIIVRYTPCAKSERVEEEDGEEGEGDSSGHEDAEVSILSRHGAGNVHSHVSAGGRGKSGAAAAGVSGGVLRLGSWARAGSQGAEDDEHGVEEGWSAGSSLDRRGGGGRVASIASGDLELTHCPHFLPRQDSAPCSAVGSSSEGRGEGRRGGTDSASCGGRSTPGGPQPCTSGTQTPTANGPRHLPGLDLYSAGSTQRTRLIGERLSSTDKISLSSPIYANKIVEQRDHSSSRQSLLEIVSSKLDRVKPKKRFSLAQGSLLKKPRLSEANVNVITNRVTRRQRRKEIEEKFGKRKSLRGDHHTRIETATSTSSDHDGCNWTFVFDPSGRLCYWWSSVVSVAFLYNFWVIIYRFAFQEISKDNIALWFTLDYTADLLYVLDIAFHFRTGYLEDGVLQTDPTKLRIHYTNTTTFYIDCLCLLPLDFLYLSIGFSSILRGFRLVKVYRFWTFLDRTERHTNYPNVVRATTLMHYLIALFHWNACLYYIVAMKLERPENTWHFPKEQEENSMMLQYLHALHWSLITLTTIGTPPTPNTAGEYVFVIFELIFALVLFATFLGHIANIVTNVSAARKEFQARLDGVKTYMNLRRVPLKLQDRVIKWFDYLWMCNKSSDEEKALSLLPDKLKAEIAIHVHLDTLKRVEIFQSTEAGFLCELVLRLRPVLFSPGDYICRNGEVGKEMYIVNRGRLHVVADNGKTVLATLKPGSYFGEISILNMGTAGNRRTASVRSVGYSDLFCLAKKDLWDVLKEYPAARVKLEAIAVKRLAKYKKQPLEKALERSRSTPGLVESAGKVPLDAMLVQRHHTLPAGLLSSAAGGHPGDRGEEADAERLRKLESTQSEDNLITRCVEERRLSSDSQHEVVLNLTTSTLTSYNGTPPLRSPSAPTAASDVTATKAVPSAAPPYTTPPPSPKKSGTGTGTGHPAGTAQHPPAPPPPPPPHPHSLQQVQQTYGYMSTVSGGVGVTLGGTDPHSGTPLHQPHPMPYPTYPSPASFPPYASGPQGQVTPMTYLAPYSTSMPYPPSPTPGMYMTTECVVGV